MELKINSTSVTAIIDRVEDYISQKFCKVVIKITQETIVDDAPVKTGYDMIERFDYSKTWTDKEAIDFATEKVNKRFS